MIADKNTEKSGIYQPVFEYRWIVKTSMSDSFDSLFSRNIISADFDLAKGTMVLVLEQPLMASGFFENLKRLSQALLTFNHMDGHDTAHSFFVVSGDVISHKYSLNYAACSDPISKHIVTFENVKVRNEGVYAEEEEQAA